MPDARNRTHRIDRIGCSGWNYASWRHGVFYPPRSPARVWLEYYARHYDWEGFASANALRLKELLGS